MPIFIGIKTNLILAPHLCGSWLHLIEVREDIKNLLQGWLFSALHYESSSMLTSLLVYKLCGMLARIIAEFLSSLVFIFHYIKHIFWNINKAGMGELWFSLLLTKSVTFIIYFLPFFVSLFLIFLTYIMTLWSYSITDLSEISLRWLCLPTLWITRWISDSRLFL